MDKTFSVALDLLRFMAAGLVFFQHVEQLLKDHRLSFLASFGHDAVIFFFILSGFVIGYVSDCKEKSLSEYFIARAARIYSVAIPSLILVYILIVVGHFKSPDVYQSAISANHFYTIGSAVAFLNETWLAPVEVPTNGPYWSISYEVWYYVIFGFAFYIKGFKRFLLVLVAAAVAGPKILVMMPIWLAGFAFYKLHVKIPRRRLTGAIVFLAAAVCYLGMRAKNIDDMIFSYAASFFGGEKEINKSMGFSKRFVPDFIIAVFFLAMICGVWMMGSLLRPLAEKLREPIKFLSAHTFSLYLFHYPILILLSRYTDNLFAVMAICLFCVVVLCRITESKRGDFALTLKSFVRA